MTFAEFYLEQVDMDQDLLLIWFLRQLSLNRAYRRAFFKLMDREIASLNLKTDGKRISPGIENADKLNRLDQAVPELLRRSGISEYTQKQLSILNERILSANDLFEAVNIEAARMSSSEILGLPGVQSQITNTTRAANQGSKKAAREISILLIQQRDYLSSGESISQHEFAKGLIQKAGILPKYAGTVASTALFSIDRTVRRAQALKAGIDSARYVGPMDAKTRRFCAAHVNQVRSWAYWDMTRNDVGPQPPSIYGGGYNCRHQLVPYDSSWETIDWGD